MSRFLLMIVLAFVAGQSIATEVYVCPKSGGALGILRYCNSTQNPYACRVFCADQRPEPKYEQGPINCPETSTTFAIVRYCRRRLNWQACINACSPYEATHSYRST